MKDHILLRGMDGPGREGRKLHYVDDVKRVENNEMRRDDDACMRMNGWNDRDDEDDKVHVQEY